MPRFVILEHDHPYLHWDLMLAAGTELRTWRLRERPMSGQPVHAEALGNHRLAYLDYEGPVSRERGTVKRWDAGTFSWEIDSVDQVTVRLHGTRCIGRATLERRADGGWRFTLST